MSGCPGGAARAILYTATHSALLLLFANNQHLVVPAVWQAIEEVGGPEIGNKVRSRVAELLADHYGSKITATDPKERLERLMKLFEEEGGLVDVVQKDGRMTVCKRSCAFISMFDPNRNVCNIELDMMKQVVGATIRRVGCRNDGDPCCSFEIDNEPSSNGQGIVHLNGTAQ